MSRSATLVVELRQITCVLQDICSPCPFRCGNGKIFPWISLWVYPTTKGYNTIWVIMDHLTKSAHFIPVKISYTAKKYAEIYFDRIVTLHGVPLTIVSDRGSVFVSRFWEQLQHYLGTHLLRSSAYHPQTDGQTERVNHVLEDMLRACAISFP